MANTMSTAGSTIKAISPALSAIPYVGAVASMAGSIAGGLLEAEGAKQQQQQAAKIREEALRTQKQELRPEYLQKKRLDEWMALQGLPGYEGLLSNMDASTAANIRNIRESSGSGVSKLNAIMAAINLGNQAKTNVGIENANVKLAAKQRLGDTLWDIGDKQRYLEDVRDRMKTEGLTAASAMENAATLNKLNAAKGIIGGVTEGANQLLGATPELANIAEQQRMAQLMQRNQADAALTPQSLTPATVSSISAVTPSSMQFSTSPYTTATSPNQGFFNANPYTAPTTSQFYSPTSTLGFW